MPRGSLDFRLHGRIKACVVQSCVVTLDPVVNEIDETLDILLRPELGNESPEGEPEEDFEPYGGDAIDVAELAAVELALALDPYPRAPGVTLECIKLRSSAVKLGEQVKDGNDRASEAFRALAALKRNK